MLLLLLAALPQGLKTTCRAFWFTLYVKYTPVGFILLFKPNSPCSLYTNTGKNDQSLIKKRYQNTRISEYQNEKLEEGRVSTSVLFSCRQAFKLFKNSAFTARLHCFWLDWQIVFCLQTKLADMPARVVLGGIWLKQTNISFPWLMNLFCHYPPSIYWLYINFTCPMMDQIMFTNIHYPENFCKWKTVEFLTLRTCLKQILSPPDLNLRKVQLTVK